MAPVLDEWLVQIIESQQREQEGMRQGGDQQQADLGFPLMEARAFENELALIEAE
jgi:hypothetical protein